MISGRLFPCQIAFSFVRRFSGSDSKQKIFSLQKQLFYRERWGYIRTMATDTSHIDIEQATHQRNRLALERSPYLLQHASNPVDWYPWSEEAFEKAREQNKLIFLSVGYSTCHWCHVMERESFENEDVAKLMNDYFINIKVDREERPDIDKIYMTFVQASTGSGGWPMSVWLTPQLTPIFGGTYFPPDDHQLGRRPGFKTLLGIIHTQWEENRSKFLESGARVIEVLKNSSTLDTELTTGVPTMECSEKCVQQLTQSYESEFGGFGSAPKFPQPSIFNFLFHYYSRSPGSEGGKKVLDMCCHTLTCMAKGGIHDHVAQGFARYSTDERWHVPHFEKMLYDQGQLAVAYATAYVATKNELYADTLRDILAYVSRDLSDKSGGFYSAEDADSLPTVSDTKKKEGAFCVWKYDEIKHLLTDNVQGTEYKESDVFAFHYDVKPNGNVNPLQDPHKELTDANVLIVTGSEAETAEEFKLDVARTKEVLERCRDKLFRARLLRPRPHLDDKMITAWNGLMISGFAKASQALKDPTYEQRAIAAAKFIKTHLYNASRGTLLRSCYRGDDGNVAQISVPINGFVDDYAFVIRGLLDLYESCLDADWLEWAEQLQAMQDQLFWDEEDAGYFSSPSGDNTVVMRMKEDQDGAEPSGNSVSVGNLIRLTSFLECPDYQDKAKRLLTGFTTRLTKVPVAMPEMASALMMYNDSVTQVFVSGQRTDPDTAALLDVVYSRLVPGRVLALADGRTDSVLYRRCEVVRGMKKLNGKAAAYVCRHHMCSLPVNNPEALSALLDQRD